MHIKVNGWKHQELQDVNNNVLKNVLLHVFCRICDNKSMTKAVLEVVMTNIQTPREDYFSLTKIATEESGSCLPPEACSHALLLCISFASFAR